MQICFVQFPMISHSLIADGWYPNSPACRRMGGMRCAAGLKSVVNWLSADITHTPHVPLAGLVDKWRERVWVREYFALYLAANQAVLINFYDGRTKWAKESGLDECSTVRMRNISLYDYGNLSGLLLGILSRALLWGPTRFIACLRDKVIMMALWKGKDGGAVRHLGDMNLWCM